LQASKLVSETNILSSVFFFFDPLSKLAGFIIGINKMADKPPTTDPAKDLLEKLHRQNREFYGDEYAEIYEAVRLV